MGYFANDFWESCNLAPIVEQTPLTQKLITQQLIA